ncbi:pupal cuticle protein C1B-like [Anoplophora glabripennis]|uniref:pupal cuticle protein C1B-like n=1 Tax=Anoplophora glabripennis TaxID=217634 RepID=UPI0008746E18|nr:pupal cuticle protein C1B-like [Anoplophora glabripennis]
MCNLGQVSTYSKTIDTPFSSVSKSDVRISNPGLKIAAAPAYQTYAAPAYAAHGYAAPAVAAPAVGVAYSAAPAVAHVTFQGLGAAYGW